MWYEMWDSEDGLHHGEVFKVLVLSLGIFSEQMREIIDCRLSALNNGYLISMCIQDTKEIPSLLCIWTSRNQTEFKIFAVLECYAA
jgi:hypothetical protein